ncbi:MAG: 30S ribosome-binding factor RbfA [Bacteroidia bacterium]|nr:30S ribosome-binding factor RbfA [Bacteroidia bacterium]
MSESIQQKKSAKLIQQELSEIIRTHSSLTMGTIVSVTVVRLTPDKGMAKIYITVFPDNQLEAVTARMNEHAPELRRQLASRIKNKFRIIPDIRFYEDDSFREAAKMDKIFKELEEGKE